MEQQTVKMQSIKGGVVKSFTIDHANSILRLQSRTPPATWRIADSETDFEIKNGKIVAVQKTA